MQKPNWFGHWALPTLAILLAARGHAYARPVTLIATSTILQTRSGTAATTAAQIAGQIPRALSVTAETFGAKGDCVTDDSEAITRAFAAVSKGGGGTVRLSAACYRANIVITGNQLALEHTGQAGYNTRGGTAAPRLTPADPLKPVVQIGDGKTATDGISLRGIYLYGEGIGRIGLRIYGASHVQLPDFTANDFSDKGIDITSSPTSPTTLVNFSRSFVRPGNSKDAVGVSIDYGESFTTAISFNQSHFITNGKTHGPLLWFKGPIIASLTDTYLDAADQQGIRFTSAAGVSGHVIATNVNLDGQDSASRVLEVPGHVSTDYLHGTYQIYGRIVTQDGVSDPVPSRAFWLPYRSVLSSPLVQSSVSFLDADTPYSSGLSKFGTHGFTRYGETLEAKAAAPGGRFQIVGDNTTLGGLYLKNFRGDGSIPITFDYSDGKSTSIYSGSLVPEGNWSAGPGSLYLRNTTGVEPHLYVKSYGVGPSGWRPITNVLPLRIIKESGPISVGVTDRVILIKKLTQERTVVELPDVSEMDTGTTITIKDAKGDANTNPIMIKPAHGFIDGAANYSISKAHGTVTLIYSGSEWLII